MQGVNSEPKANKECIRIDFAKYHSENPRKIQENHILDKAIKDLEFIRYHFVEYFQHFDGDKIDSIYNKMAELMESYIENLKDYLRLCK